MQTKLLIPFFNKKKLAKSVMLIALTAGMLWALNDETLNTPLRAAANLTGQIVAPTPTAGSASPAVWLAPQGFSAGNAANSNAYNVDFMDMFQDNAPWSFTAAHTNVFLMYGGGATRQASQSQINAVIAYLKNHHIALAVTGELFYNPATCDPTPGFGVKQAEAIAQKIATAGGDIQYLVMDEPLFWGHYGGVRNTGCHTSIDDTLKSLDAEISAYQRYFPNIQIGEEEIVGNVEWASAWRQDYGTWTKRFQAAFQQPLAFVQLDIPLANGTNQRDTSISQKNVDDAVAFYNEAQDLKRQGYLKQIGIIIDGTQLDEDNAAWVMDAQDHLLMWLATYNWRPDQLIFQSWVTFPSHALPENASDTLTSLVPFYFSYLAGKLPSPVPGTVAAVVTASNGKLLSVTGQHNGNAYTVDASQATLTAPAALDQVQKGDVLEISGMFQGLTIKASRIQDITVQSLPTATAAQ